jgi:hypothetical protein
LARTHTARHQSRESEEDQDVLVSRSRVPHHRSVRQDSDDSQEDQMDARPQRTATRRARVLRESSDSQDDPVSNDRSQWQRQISRRDYAIRPRPERVSPPEADSPPRKPLRRGQTAMTLSLPLVPEPAEPPISRFGRTAPGPSVGRSARQPRAPPASRRNPAPVEDSDTRSEMFRGDPDYPLPGRSVVRQNSPQRRRSPRPLARAQTRDRVSINLPRTPGQYRRPDWTSFPIPPLAPVDDSPVLRDLGARFTLVSLITRLRNKK